MVHSITETLQPINPPLDPGETLEVYYFTAAHAVGPRSHAFAVVIHRSSSKPTIEIISPPSLSPETHNQRGNLGAVITVFEWLELNQAQDHDVTIYSPDDHILMLPEKVAAWAKDRKRSCRDLYEKLLPRPKGWPRVQFMRPPTLVPHAKRRERAEVLAKERLIQGFPAVE